MRHIKQVVSKKELAAFIDFPHKLFEGDVNYVPELHIAQGTYCLLVNIRFMNIQNCSFF